MKFRAMIIDDEAIARKRLRGLLDAHQEKITIIDEAADGIEALEKIQQHNPDLIFLDIQMPGHNGFEVVRKLARQPLIIFTTAYDEYALAAFKENAIEYLLKPIAPDELERAIRKLDALAGKRNDWESSLQGFITRLDAASQKPSRMQVKVGDTIKLVDYDKILYFESDEKYTTLFTENSEFIIDQSLNELEEKLPGKDFVRIHRKHIVNVNHIAEIKKWFDRRLLVVLKSPKKIELTVSRHYIDNMKNI
jgi:two-component system LytT family response regulator